MPEGTEATETATDTEAATETTETQVDHAAEAEKWKAQARKHEDRAKANANAAKELEALKLASLDDTGKAVETARSEARAEALLEVGGKLVAAEFKVAAAGRPLDVDTLLEGLDRTKFLTDDGDPDSEAIAAWVDRIAPATTETADETPPGFPPMPDLGQGSRQTVPLGSDPLLDLLKGTVGVK
jgi:hypothetical protein